MRSKNYTLKKENWYCCDFETITPNTLYFKKHQDTKVILVSIKQYGGDKYFNFISLNEWWKWVLDLEQSCTFFFHNLTFDGDFIIKFLVNEKNFSIDYNTNNKNKVIELFKNQGKIYYFRIKFKKRCKDKKLKNIQLVFRCSYLLLSSSINALGKDLGINKFEGIEPSKIKTFYDREPFNSIDEVDKEYLDYCNRDVLIMEKALQIFETSIKEPTKIGDVNIFHYLTVGSLAMGIIKNYYLYWYNKNKPTKIGLKISQESYKLLKPFFYGGYTQFNEKYQKEPSKVDNGYFIDIVSAYPFQMTQALPYGEVLFTKPLTNNYVEWCIVKVKYAKLKEKYWNVPTLKNWKFEGSERYVRELKNFKCFYCKEELDIICEMYDMEIDDIISIYQLKAPYLKEYIEDLFFYKEKYKNQGKKNQALSFKILLNSSYGKLATRAMFNSLIFTKEELKNGEKIRVDEKDYEVLHTSQYEDIGEFKAYTIKPLKEKLYLMNIGAAAYITAKQRVYLWQQIIDIGADKFIYSDTDSIACENPDISKIKIGKKLGEWELEKQFNLFGVYGAKKYMSFQDDKLTKIGMSGISENYFKNESNDWDYEKLKELSFDKDKFTLENAVLQKQRCKSGIILYWKTKEFHKGGL